MLSKNSALLVAGLVFLIVALLHLIRLNDHTVILVGSHLLPMQASVAGLIVALILSIWMFAARSRKK